MAAPKIAALGVLMRLLSGPFYHVAHHWQPILLTMALLSMLVGAVAAILQTSLKRFLAYASISSVGFSLLGLALVSEEGLRASLFYTTLYIVAIIGFLSCIMVLLRRGYGVEDLSDLKGLATDKPFMAGMMTLLLLSLSGLPPFPGFLGKLFLLQAAIATENYIPAFVMVMTTVVAVYYYLNIIKIMFFDPSTRGESPAIIARVFLSYSVIAFSLAIMIFVIFAPTYLLHLAGLAASTLFYS
jgi:NADH-quinone oxidoreductase subunit N